MYARAILIRAIDCINSEGYVSKEDALIHDKQSTAYRVESSLAMSPEIGSEENAKHGTLADCILTWVLNYSGQNEYLHNCKSAAELADANPQKAYGYLCSLVKAYDRQQQAAIGLDKVTKPATFVNKVGASIDNLECEVLNVQLLDGYKRISLLGPDGHLLTYTQNYDVKNGLTPSDIGCKVYITATVYRNKILNTPVETVLSRPKVTKVK